MELVIIGCGAAGGTAAQFARKQDRNAAITIFEKGMYPQYSKCGLPYTLSGKIPFTELIEFSEDWFRKSHIDLHLNTEVEDIDFENKLVVTSQGKKEYDSLIITTGVKPVVPFPVPSSGIHFLRTLSDAQGIKKRMTKGKKAVIIGGGPTGLEAAEALVSQGMCVTLIEYLPDILPAMLDADMAHLVRESFDCKGDMRILTGHEVTKVREGFQIFMKNREISEELTLPADLVIVASGNTPMTDLVGGDMVETGIVVNERCATKIKDVYAAGDCTQYTDILGETAQVGLGSVAVRQGKVAGINAAGGHAHIPPLLNTRVTKIFGTEIAAVGPLTKQIKGAVVGKYRGSTHPHYIPGEPVSVKVIATQKGKLVAGQIIGPGAAHRINTIAAAISCSMDLHSFSQLETAYAPVVSPVFDPASVASEIALRRL